MPSNPTRIGLCAAFVLCLIAAQARADLPVVTAMRTPNGGLQPQAAVDDKGTVHLVYLKGDPAASDVYYVRSTDGGATWSDAVRVNSQAGSALAIGTVRGAHLALGSNGAIQVAWAGSQRAEPKPPGGQAPMLYARGSVDASGNVTFEPQRNVVTTHAGLDGGDISADDKGHVYIAWHAPARKGGHEDDRRVWVAISADDGKTFAPETAISDDSLGVCGCCGLAVLAGRDGRLFALYRGESAGVNRDIYLATADTTALQPSSGQAARPSADKIAATRSSNCLMSTASLVQGPKSIVAAWEAKDQVQWGVIDPASGRMSDPVTVPGTGCKHPTAAINARGKTLIAWAVGTGWNKGGSVAWQAYDSAGKPIPGTSSHADGLAVWSKPAAFARANGSFAVLY